MHDAWRRELAAGGDECIGKAEPTSSCRLGQRATVVTAAEAAAAEDTAVLAKIAGSRRRRVHRQSRADQQLSTGPTGHRRHSY